MKIGIPCAQRTLCMHFGHCEEFTLVQVDEKKKAVTAVDYETPPPHAPGVLPQWLGERNVDVVIAGGMGMRAQQLFQAQGIQVVTGATGGSPEALAAAYLDKTLQTGDNVCDH